jgi:hypothetical protein
MRKSKKLKDPTPPFSQIEGALIRKNHPNLAATSSLRAGKLLKQTLHVSTCLAWISEGLFETIKWEQTVETLFSKTAAEFSGLAEV